MRAIAAGVHVALVTPLDADGQLAEDSLQGLLTRLQAAGLSGYSILGSTGECAGLAAEIRHRLMQRVRQWVDPALPVFSGVVESRLAAARREADAAAEAGMDAILLPPPFYYPMTAAEVATFYRTMADRSPLPLILYNIPPFTKVTIPVEVVADLADHPNVAGIKDSSGDFHYFQACVAATAGKAFQCFTGSDDLLLAALAVGGSGTICASANAVPESATGIVRRWQAGDREGALAQQRRLAALIEVARALGGYRAWKAAVELKGHQPCRVAAPYHDLAPQARQTLQAALERLAASQG